MLAPRAPGEISRVAYRPVLDGDVLPKEPIDALRDVDSAHTPLKIGCTRGEMAVIAPVPHDIDAAEMHRRVAYVVGASGSRMIGAYNRLMPSATPADLTMAIISDSFQRVPITRQAEAHVAGGGSAHVYVADFAQPAGIGDVSLAAEMSHRLAEFARSRGGGPRWPKYDTSTRATPRFGSQVVLDDDTGNSVECSGMRFRSIDSAGRPRTEPIRETVRSRSQPYGTGRAGREFPLRGSTRFMQKPARRERMHSVP